MNLKVTKLNINLGSDQQYSEKDIALINSIQLQRKFGLPEDYIELHIYDLNNSLLKSNYNYLSYRNSFKNLITPNSLIDNISFNPSEDAIDEGFNVGSVILEYNLYRKLFNSNINNKFFIKNISSDRTELRIANNNISNSDLENLYLDFLIKFNQEPYYKDFNLNFSNNINLLGVNISLEKDPIQYNLLIKLYEPLPIELTIKDQFWIIERISDSINYQVDFEIIPKIVVNSNNLKGPNFNIKINNEINPSINYINYNSFFSNTSTSSYQQIKSLLEEKNIEINIDYSDYSNFIHFSSAKERILNFLYKLNLIENYQRDYNILLTLTSTTQVSASKATIETNINNIIEKFDGYEYYLYFESGSNCFPKKNNIKPYINYELTSSIAQTWIGSDNSKSLLYGGQIYSASYYDSNNQDNLVYSIPEYLKIDENNKNYELFLSMIGQHFDNLWLYSKAVTDIYDTNNNPDKGISKDLVSYALKSFGVNLYSNTNTKDNIFNYLLGITPSGSYNIPTGSELITNIVTASQYRLAGSDIDKEVYKRIYHNLPYLLKSKGTERGLRALISCYGIPDTILRINEFGGSDKEANSYEQYLPTLTYGLNTKSGSIFVATPWAPSFYQSLSSSIGSGSIVPDVVEFRFKSYGTPNPENLIYSQSLWQINSGSDTQLGLQLIYNPNTSTGSYINYGTLKLVISGSQGYIFSDPINLPFHNKDWWNVMVYRETGSLVSSSINNNNRYWVYVANSIYNGNDGQTIGYIGSSSLFISGSTSSSYNRSWNLFNTSSLISYFGGNNNNDIISNNKFRGFFQEIRYWIGSLSLDSFKSHTLNPLSIENNTPTGSYSSLIYRLSLGADLKISSDSNLTSIHPTITGSSVTTGSFIWSSGTTSIGTISSPGSSLYGVAIYGVDNYLGGLSTIVYTSTSEFHYLKSGNLGISKPNNSKIRIPTSNIISGNTLSPFTKITKDYDLPLSKDINTVEVAFSPQDQINNDIINQLGYFDIDDYIGNPKYINDVKYPELEELKNFYFKKYISSYNLYDYIRLIQYYNNSLFKMIKDFIPGRINSSTGIIIKPHYLERSKIKSPSSSYQNLTYSGSVNKKIVRIIGSEGGIFTSSLNYSNTNKWESFTGNIQGNNIIVTDQSLQQSNIFLNRSQSISINSFIHSDFYTTLNNVSESVTSNKFYKVEYNNSIYPNNLNLLNLNSPLFKASIQDSNYSSLKSITSKYLGSKLSSTKYNIYTEGDKSYGKSPVIDNNNLKIGLFTSITGSKFFNKKQEVRLKYLVNEKGELTELNRLNNNWFEIQNIFKANTTSSITLFDNNKFGDQKNTEGEKIIFNSGYNYSPYFYYSASDATAAFEIPSDNLDIFKYNNVSSSYIRTTVSQSDPATANLTFMSYASGDFTVRVSPAVYSINIKVTSMDATTYLSTTCGAGDSDFDYIDNTDPLIIPSGTSQVSHPGMIGLPCLFPKYRRGTTMVIENSTPSGPLSSGNTFTISGCSTLFTLVINGGCNTYSC